LNFPGGVKRVGEAPLKGMPAFKAPGFLCEVAFSRGGLEILEVLARRGAPEGGMVVQVTNLAEAEDCYLGLKWLLDSFIKQNPREISS